MCLNVLSAFIFYRWQALSNSMLYLKNVHENVDIDYQEQINMNNWRKNVKMLNWKITPLVFFSPEIII